LFVKKRISHARPKGLEAQGPQREEQEEDLIFIASEPVAMNNKLPPGAKDPFSLLQLAGMKKCLLSSHKLCASSGVFEAGERQISYDLAQTGSQH
jgi:hypothetical protein